MKYFYLLIVFLVAATVVDAQVLFRQDFENGIAPMTVKDLSGRTVHASVANLAGGWVAVSGATYGSNSIVAASTSWFNPAGQADAWLITPAIAIENEGTILKWTAKAQDPSYRDGYQVLVSTTGTEVGDFTDIVFQIGSEVAEYTERSLLLDDYVGESIHIAFRNNSIDQFILVLDDIIVETLLDFNIELDELVTPRYHLLGSSVAIEGSFTNTGKNTITSLDLNWTHGGETRTQTISDLDLGYGATYEFSHEDNYEVLLSTNEEIRVSITNVNGVDTLDFSSKFRNVYIQGLSQIPAKSIVYEEGTGTWCGWCPRGFVAMEYMEENYSNFIGIGVHNGDPMVVTEYDNNINLSGYPSSNVDRVLNDVGVSPEAFVAYYDYLADAISPVSATVLAEYDAADNRTVTIDVSATFYGDFEGDDFRFSVIIVEDSIRGTASGYAQVNFYNLNTNPTAPVLVGYGFNWNQEANPVPASKMFYNHVPVAILGGYYGEQGSIPSSITNGQTVSKTYTYQVGTARIPENMKAVVFVLDANTGAILNAAQTKFDIKLGSTSIASPEKFNLKLYPNPASVELNVELNMPSAADLNYRIINTSGQVVLARKLGMTSGDIKMIENVSQLAPGVYSLVINAGNEVVTKNFVVE